MHNSKDVLYKKNEIKMQHSHHQASGSQIPNKCYSFLMEY